MMRHLRGWILGFLVFWAVASEAQVSLSLEECVRIALAEDVQRQVAERQRAIAAVNHHGSLAGRYPTLAFNMQSQGSLANQQNPASFLNGLIRSGNAAFSLDASWVVFDGFRARLNEKRLGQLEWQSQARLREASLQTVRRVTLAYLQAEWEQARVGLAREALALSMDIYREQEERRSLGLAVQQQVLQSRDAVFTDSSQLIMAQLSARVALLQLRVAMGRPDGPAFEVGGALEGTPLLAGADQWSGQVMARHPLLEEARIQKEIMQLQTRIRQASYYPRVVINTGAVWSGNVIGLDGNNPFTGEPFGLRRGTNRNAYAGLGLQLPLFDGGLRRRQVEEARLMEDIARWSETGVQRELIQGLRTLTETHVAQVQLYELSQRQEDNARQLLDVSGERYRLGQLSLFDYRAVQLSYTMAVQRRLQALYQWKVTEVEILTLTGDLLR